MERASAVKLLEQALDRIKHPQRNINGGSEQTGGAYWRLAQVLELYLEPRLEEQEGEQHARDIKRLHGVIRKPGAVIAESASEAVPFHGIPGGA